MLLTISRCGGILVSRRVLAELTSCGLFYGRFGSPIGRELVVTTVRWKCISPGFLVAVILTLRGDMKWLALAMCAIPCRPVTLVRFRASRVMIPLPQVCSIGRLTLGVLKWTFTVVLRVVLLTMCEARSSVPDGT